MARRCIVGQKMIFRIIPRVSPRTGQKKKEKRKKEKKHLKADSVARIRPPHRRCRGTANEGEVVVEEEIRMHQ